jgi:hypothetical protein
MDSDYDEITDIGMKRPHLVLVGAGASRAAFPSGDKNGNRLPLMNDLIEITNIEPLLKKYDVKYQDVNFEKIYSEIHESKNYNLISEIEEQIYQYFSKLEMPEIPTIYDHLIMSLRAKDVIATFNWDPFLYEAWSRNFKRTGSPKLFFLHGNVRIGYCNEHSKKGLKGKLCPKCGKPYQSSKLLYPIEKKGYHEDLFIKNEWGAVKHYMSQAYIFTIFGYGAPESDVEAIRLLKEGWGNKYSRNLEEVEIIDIKEEDELTTLWDPFIHTHHYHVHKDFYDSIIARYPRRSCEANWARTMEMWESDGNDFPRNLNFIELEEWLRPRIDFEKSNN